MKIKRKALKAKAKSNIKKDFWTVCAACLIASLPALAISGISMATSTMNILKTMETMGAFTQANTSFTLNISPISSIASLAVTLISGTLTVGMAVFFLNLANGKEARIENVFSQFKHHWSNTFVMQLIITIKTVLWTMLFIVPGIVANLNYFATPYILAEHPEIKANDAIEMSKRMMYGHKGELFRLGLSFIGWSFLVAFTFGLAALYVIPYIQATMAEFFNEISGNNYEKALNSNEENIQSTENPENIANPEAL